MKEMNSDIANKKVLSGAPGAPGIVIGKAHIYERSRPRVSRTPVEDAGIEEQLDEFRKAREEVKQELQHVIEQQRDDSASELVRMQIEIIKDPELNRQIEHQIIEQNRPADAAVEMVFETYLSAMGQNEVEDKSVDITDIRDRLIQIIHDYDKDELVENSILVARELSPREVIECYERNIKGIIMDRGGVNSHAAIIARSIGIPTILGTRDGTSIIVEEAPIILDGQSGQAIINPDENTRQQYQQLIDQHQEQLRNEKKICDEPNETADGSKFCLRANIEFTEELKFVRQYRAEGVGLLRTESIYLRHHQFDDQKKQEAYYKKILEGTGSGPVTIRLFDAGGDKLLGNDSSEQNPFLGWRGIRMLLDNKDMLKRQLRAIAQTASTYRERIKILIPMVSTTDEFVAVRALLDEVQQSLNSEGITVDANLSLGIMVEVPNVALQTEYFAEQADFLSIGTNDLTQYVLAVDRGNEQISHLYNQRHPAVWQLIKKVADEAQKAETPLSVCGELASDPVSACCLMGLGIDELSMNPAMLPAVKSMLRTHTLSEMEQLGRAALRCNTIEEINSLFANWKSPN